MTGRGVLVAWGAGGRCRAWGRWGRARGQAAEPGAARGAPPAGAGAATRPLCPRVSSVSLYCDSSLEVGDAGRVSLHFLLGFLCWWCRTSRSPTARSPTARGFMGLVWLSCEAPGPFPVPSPPWQSAGSPAAPSSAPGSPVMPPWLGSAVTCCQTHLLKLSGAKRGLSACHSCLLL